MHVDPRLGFLCSRLENLNLADELPDNVALPAKLPSPARRALRKARNGRTEERGVSGDPWHISWDEVAWPARATSVFQKSSNAVLGGNDGAGYDSGGETSPQGVEEMWNPPAPEETRSSRSRSRDAAISRAAVSDIMSSSDYVEVLRGLFDSSSLTQGAYPPYGTGGMSGTAATTTARHSSQILQQYYAGAPVLPSADASSDRSESGRHSLDNLGDGNDDLVTSSSRRTSGSDEHLPPEGVEGRQQQQQQQHPILGLAHPQPGHENSTHAGVAGANLSGSERGDDRNSHVTTLGMMTSSLPSISADIATNTDTWSGKEKDTTREGFKSFLYALLRRQVAAGRAVSPDVNLFEDTASTPASPYGLPQTSGSIAYLAFSQIVPRGRVSATTAARAFQHLLGLHSRAEITLQQKQAHIKQVADNDQDTATLHPLYITASTRDILLFSHHTFHPEIPGLTTSSCEASLQSDKHNLSRILNRHHVSSPCNAGHVAESHHILVGA